MRLHARIGTTLALSLCCLLSPRAIAQTQQSARAAAVSAAAPLPVEQVVKNLEQRNAQRAAELAGFSGTRVYSLQYSGFSGDRDAQVTVNVVYRAPDAKQFTVVSEKGSKLLIDHVLKKLMEGEQEAAANAESRRQSALSSENYSFALAGYEQSPEGGRYILELTPKTDNKFLYRGKIWVDARDFAVVRIAAEPAKNPSFWVKKTDIAHQYIKVDDLWLPQVNHTESLTRFGGHATLDIQYSNYKITKAALPAALSAKNAHP